MNATMTSNGPSFVAPYRPDHGGVDFLGMRQVNVDMMAGVFPGINNVTRWVRPFSVLSWIYWKFFRLATADGIAEPSGALLRAWREKVEVLFTWGHKQEGWEGLPGISFNPPAAGAVPLAFSDWGRNANNTSLMAAVQYGPAAKTLGGLGFLEPETGPFFRACAEGNQLAEALDGCLADLDTSGLLKSLQPASATPEQARELLKGWSLATLTVDEKAAFSRAFYDEGAVGQDSAIGRRSTSAMLIRDLLSTSGTALSLPLIRAGLFFRRPISPVNGSEMDELRIGWLRWQVLQMRQLQRLAMEALLSWFEVRLSVEQDSDTTAITAAAIAAIQSEPSAVPPAGDLAAVGEALAAEAADMDAFLDLAKNSPLWSPFQLIERIQQGLRLREAAVVPYALRGLLVCVRFAGLMQNTKLIRPELMQGMSERMSLMFLKETMTRCANLHMVEFIRYLFENLILSQHFSVAARRFDGQTQRLRISIEEDGLTFLADKPLEPVLTPDRLWTAISLMADCGLLKFDPVTSAYSMN